MQQSLSDFLSRVPPVFDTSVGQLVLGLGVLVVAFGLALMVAAFVRGVLRWTGLRDRLAGSLRSVARLVLGPERAAEVDMDALGGRILFWGLAVLAVAGFASIVDLGGMGGPGGALLSGFSAFIVRLGRALVLLLVAWAAAAVLRRAARAAFSIARVEERMGESEDDAGARRLSHVVPEALYWIVLLLFLPSVLSALELQGVLLPVETIVDQVIVFLPNVFGALIIFGMGWFVARIVRALVANLLAAAGLDRAADRLGVRRVLGPREPSTILGTVAYVIFLFPVILSGLDQLRLDVITDPASEMLGRVLGAAPLVLVAAALLVTAYVVGRIISNLVRDLLRDAGFDRVLARLGFTGAAPAAEEHQPSNVVRLILLTVIMLFAAIEAASLVGFENLAGLLSRLLQFAGQFLLGVVFLGFGIFLANLSARAIRASSMPQARLLAVAARIGILLFTTAVGLRQMGIANEIIELAFGIVLGAVAVAFAVAFGLGGRDAAARQIESWRDGLRRPGE